MYDKKIKFTKTKKLQGLEPQKFRCTFDKKNIVKPRENAMRSSYN